MSEKVMVDIYFTYGKGDGDELYERFIINNTAKERQEVLDEISFDHSMETEEEFTHGEVDSFTFGRYGGDWDEPTGGYIVVNTKEELIDSIKQDVENEIANIKKKFKRV